MTMTIRELRDHFAGLAMQSLVPQFREMFHQDVFDCWVGDAIPELAKEAYYLADEMLKAGGYDDR
jgi:hypothetical protein